MIKHIVIWKLKETAEGKSKQENALKLKKELESLNGKIPGLIRLEVGIHIKDSKSNEDDSDVILYSEFNDMQSLEDYYPHPEHIKIIPFAKAIRQERRVINYEVEYL